MKKLSSLLLVCLLVLALAQPAQSSHSAPQDLSVNGEPPMLGVHWARGLEPYTRVREAAKGGNRGKKNPDMTYHDGSCPPISKSAICNTSGFDSSAPCGVCVF
jgi:hypothetical protein